MVEIKTNYVSHDEDFNNINYILGDKIYFTSIQILIWSTEHKLNIPFLEGLLLLCSNPS